MSIENPYDPDEARRAAMMDGSGFSRHLAEFRTSEDAVVDSQEPPKRVARQRATRSTGRHTIEPSGRDRERMLANQDALDSPMSPEDRRKAATRGAALARQALRDALPDLITRREQQVESMIPIRSDYAHEDYQARERHLTALLRKDFDTKK